MIGIDRNTWLVYEGVSTYGHGIWPLPVISMATLIENEDGWKTLPTSPFQYETGSIFREDSYDPVTRIRRGRLYAWDGQMQPRDWYVQQHPGLHPFRRTFSLSCKLPLEFSRADIAQG